MLKNRYRILSDWRAPCAMTSPQEVVFRMDFRGCRKTISITIFHYERWIQIESQRVKRIENSKIKFASLFRIRWAESPLRLHRTRIRAIVHLVQNSLCHGSKRKRCYNLYARFIHFSFSPLRITFFSAADTLQFNISLVSGRNVRKPSTGHWMPCRD